MSDLCNYCEGMTNERFEEMMEDYKQECDPSERKLFRDIKRPDGSTENVALDFYMVDIIEKLNDMGYYTEYCCSGHMEDAFLGMYIVFLNMDESKCCEITRLINKIPELYIEASFEISPDLTCKTNHFVRLINPTDEELVMARKLCFREDYANADVVTKYQYFNMSIRPTVLKEYEEYAKNIGNVTDDDIRDYIGKFAETNRDRVLPALYEFLKALETL